MEFMTWKEVVHEALHSFEFWICLLVGVPLVLCMFVSAIEGSWFDGDN